MHRKAGLDIGAGWTRQPQPNQWVVGEEWSEGRQNKQASERRGENLMHGNGEEIQYVE
jgi:hypothetical protein